MSDNPCKALLDENPSVPHDQGDMFGLVVGGDAVASARKVGRPKGAKNKSTEELRRKVQRSGQTPAEFLISVYRSDPQDVARKYAMKMPDVLKLQTNAALSLLPYTESKITPDMTVEQTIAHITLTDKDKARALADAKTVIDGDGSLVDVPPIDFNDSSAIPATAGDFNTDDGGGDGL